MASSFVIIDNFDVQGIASSELEADTPSCVYRNGPLTPAIALQSMKTNAVEYAKVARCSGDIEGKQQIDSGIKIQPSEPVGLLSFPNFAARTVGPRAYHGKNVLRRTLSAKSAA
jgi:hypothetical protein